MSKSAKKQDGSGSHGKSRSATSSYFSMVLNEDTSNFENQCKLQFAEMEDRLFKIRKAFLVCNLKAEVQLSTIFQNTHKKVLLSSNPIRIKNYQILIDMMKFTVFYYAKLHFPPKCNHKGYSLNSEIIKVRDQFIVSKLGSPNWILNWKRTKKIQNNRSRVLIKTT